MKYGRLALRFVSGRPLRSILIMLLQALMVALFLLGYSVLREAQAGLENGFRMSFTGDAFIQAASARPMSLFGDMTPSLEGLSTAKGIPDAEKVLDILGSVGVVDGHVPVLAGTAELKYRRHRDIIRLFGVEFPSYADFFGTLPVVEGRVPAEGEGGALLTLERALELEKITGHRPVSGNSIVLTRYIDGGFRIKKVMISGIIDYPGGTGELEDLVLVDHTTLRYLLEGFTDDKSLQIGDPLETVLSVSEIDSLFIAPAGEVAGETPAYGDDAGSSRLRRSDGSGTMWHYVLLRFSEDVRPGPALAEVEDRLQNLSVQVGDWRRAAGTSAVFILSLRVVMGLGYLLIAFAGTIAIVNMHVVSVIERTGELGTLRAMGAYAADLRLLVHIEAVILSIAGGLFGGAAAYGVSSLIDRAGTTIGNSLYISLFGRSVLDIPVTPGMLVLGVGVSVLLGVLATGYPVRMVTGLSPSRAMAGK